MFIAHPAITPLSLYSTIEVQSCVAWLHETSKKTLPDEVLLDNDDRKAKISYVPLGVVRLSLGLLSIIQLLIFND